MTARQDLSGETLVDRPNVPASAATAPVRRQARVTRPPRIALFGLFGCGNMGNDGSLQAMLECLADTCPEAEIVCICDNPEMVEKRFKIPTIPISGSRQRHTSSSGGAGRLRKVAGKIVDIGQAFTRMRGFDAMVVPGTGILDDFGERPYGMPLDIFRWCLAARAAGARVAFVSIGAGPIRNRLNRHLMRAAARLAHYRSYRDRISRDFMESIGLDVHRDPVYPDIAFRLSPERLRKAEPRDGRAPTVGVGVMSYRGWYGFGTDGDSIYADYMAKLRIFVLHLIDHGYNIRLLTGETSDDAAVAEMLERVRSVRPETAGARMTVEPAASLHDLMRQISGCDVVVATRFHNIVCSLKVGRPTISLGYARKNDVLMTEMGLGQFCQHVEHFDVGLLIEHFEQLMANGASYERRIREKTKIFETQLRQQDEMLLSSLMPAR